MRRFFVSGLFLLFICLCAGAADVQILNVSGHSTAPASVYPGDIVAMVVTISNASSRFPATEAVAAIRLNESYFEPITPSVNLGKIYPSDSTNAVFRFRVKESAYAGLYNFSVIINYTNGETNLQRSEDVNMTVLECYSLDVSKVSLDTYSPHIGDVFKIVSEISNTCSGEARDVQVKLIPVTNSSLDPFVAVSDTVLQVGNIPAGGSKKAAFSLRVSDKAVPQTYVFTLDANCLDCPKTDTETLSFEVFGKPDLIISGVDFSIDSRPNAETILGGDTFSFSIQLDNIGKETAKAVVVKIETDESINGIKEGYIGNIDADDSGSAVFDLVVSPGAEAGDHRVDILINYINEMGEEQALTKGFNLYIHARPPESPIGLLILIIIILVLLYFIIKMVFRQLAMRRA